MIREATINDTTAIVDKGLTMIASTPYAAMIKGDRDTMSATVTSLISNGVVLIATIDDAIVGMLGLATYTHPVSGERMTAEIFWWVDPEYRGWTGIRLLKRAEEWAREAETACLQMVAPTADIERLYERLGYARTEVSYHKSLTLDAGVGSRS